MGQDVGTKSIEPLEAVTDDPDAAYKKIKETIEAAKDQTNYQRWVFERAWFRNLLYYAGNQWITYDRSNRRYRERRLRKWVPKPVTNRFASTANAIAAAIENIKPDVSYRPSTSDPEDVATAAVCERVTPVIDSETHLKNIKARLAKWTTLTGNSYASPGYNLSWANGSRFIQSLQCQACGTVFSPMEVDVIAKCPECESPYMTDALDQGGSPLGRETPVGVMEVDVLSPFEVYVDMQVEGIQGQFQILRIRSFDLETIKRTWETAKNIEEKAIEQEPGESYEYRNSIAYITDSSAFTGGVSMDKIRRATVYRIDRLPDEVFPEGLYAIMVGDQILEATPLPYTHKVSGQETQFLPYIQFGYEAFPGRHYYKTPCDDLIPKQDQRNRIESLIELCIMRGAYNDWLLPVGSGISSLTGEPGQKITYDPNQTAGQKPEIISTNPVPPSLPAWISQIDSDLEELAGTFDVLKGNVPKGVSAGYAIQLLTERGFSRFGSVFENWENAWRELRMQELSIFRVYATEERIQTIMGRHGQWETEKFLGSDLMGGVDVVIESGEAKPKSQLAMQASIEQLITLGVIDVGDPEQRYQIAEKYGMASVLGGVDVDRREASRESEEFLQGVPPTVQIWIDNHDVHIGQHQSDAKNDTFKELPPEVRNFWGEHVKMHAIAKVMVLMQLAGPMALDGGGEANGSSHKPVVDSGGKGDKSPSKKTQLDQTNNINRKK